MPHNLHSAAATIPATSWGIFRVPLISVHRLATICEKTWRKKYETWLAAYESKLKTTRDSSDRSMSVESNVTEVVLARGDTLRVVSDLKVTIACASVGILRPQNLDNSIPRTWDTTATPLPEAAQAIVAGHREDSIHGTLQAGRSLGSMKVILGIWVIMPGWANNTQIPIDQKRSRLNKADLNTTLDGYSQDRSGS
ncbi:MAG: hypothetical protein L6R36_000079 [Xanthoria steineri]|nr:MAG: hypothetical protein L6R36_000079 [Xanthoria steineri]